MLTMTSGTADGRSHAEIVIAKALTRGTGSSGRVQNQVGGSGLMVSARGEHPVRGKGMPPTPSTTRTFFQPDSADSARVKSSHVPQPSEPHSTVTPEHCRVPKLAKTDQIVPVGDPAAIDLGSMIERWPAQSERAGPRRERQGI